MSLAELVAVLEGAALVTRSKAVQDLVRLALSKLDDPVGIATEGEAPLSNAERQARFRARRRNGVTEEVTESNVTRNGESNVSPLSLISSDLELSSEIPTGSGMSTGAGATPEASRSSHESRTQPVAKRARGTRIPSRDEGDAALEQWVLHWGIRTADNPPEWAKFLSHFRAATNRTGLKVDWRDTWDNWLRRAPEFSQTRLNPGPAPPPKPVRRTDGMRCGIHGREACKCDSWRLERVEVVR